ncbi:MAG: tripartite tricarboxylate transporter TctB family protein [Desulfobacterales bacterium]|nr:tripartite tricarboxylate transporter TctB family protein [Desulfobacterales bacterium]
MKKANIIISVVLLIFGSYYAFLTSRLPTRNLPNTLGIDFMPWLLVVLLFIVVLLLLLKTVLRKPLESFDPKISSKEGIGIIFLTIFLYAYVQAMHLFGFVWVTPVFMAVLMVMTGSRKWKEIVVLSIVSPMVIYVFFQKIFQVVLPGGKFF